MIEIITKHEIKKILGEIRNDVISTREQGAGVKSRKQVERFVDKKLYELADKIISKINENIQTKLDKTLKEFLMMDLERASRYASRRDKILKRMGEGI